MVPQDLVEAGEAAAVVGAILWLVQTILETLQRGELDAWLHRVGLAGAIGELKSEVERMETVAKGARGRAVGNKPLARSLARAKELMYGADDLVDELDYCRLQQQVEEGVMLAPGIELESMAGDGAGHVDASANTAVVMLAPTNAIEPDAMVGDGDNRDGAEHIDASASADGIPANNSRKNRCKERDYFHITPAVNGEPAKAKCIDCGTEVLWGHGTSVLRKHRNSARCRTNKRAAIQKAPNGPSAGDNVQNGAIIASNGSEARKRMRTEGNVVTAAPHWNKDKFLKRIHEIALELGGSRGYVIEYLKDSVASFDQYQSNTTSDTGVGTSGTLYGGVYGRYNQKKYIMSVIEYAKSNNITVLPIAGIVGVGKTTLAKLVYNDPLVKSQFERIWVWVSSIFDEVRVTREILDAITIGRHEGSPHNREIYGGVSNYTKLQEILTKHMACQTKKFLLVLDDVNDSMSSSQWKVLLDALGSSCTKGNVIITTTRYLSVAQKLGTVKPVKLGALEDSDLWLLFKACTFGDNNHMEHLDIDRQISAKLNGNPLAVESLAEMLRDQPFPNYWESIMKNGVWESLEFQGGIVSTLKISYYQLPYHLQQCFLVCSVFPNNHQFHIDDLVYMWISLGFAKSSESGRHYLNALVNSGFLEQVEILESTLWDKKFYVVCGIMHEFARLVSRTDFAVIDGLECKEVLPTVRHLSILTDSMYRIDEHGIIPRNLKFEEQMESLVSPLKKLRTLILIGHYDPLFFQSYSIICNSVNCTHLRYLKHGNKGSINFQKKNKGSIEDLLMFSVTNYLNIGNEWSHEALPISFSKFHHLEVLDARCLAMVHGISDLVSMRHLVLTNGLCGASNTAWHACLQTINLEDCEGWERLPSLESLSSLTKLKLRNMPEVTELLIPSLEELVLIDMPKLVRCLSNSMRDLNSSLRALEIRRCQILKSFPLFESCENFGIEQKSWLPNVSELIIHECPHLVVSNPLPPSSRFCKLSIEKVSALPKMQGSSNTGLKIGFLYAPCSVEFLDDKILSFHNLMTITQLDIAGLQNLLAVSLKGLWQLVCLKRLEIQYCPKLFSSNALLRQAHEDMAAADFDGLPSLKCLSISYCGITGAWLSLILQHVRSLEELNLNLCEKITGLSIQGKDNILSYHNRIGALLIEADQLKKMSIKNCKLKFYGNKELGLSGFTSLEELRIDYCAELISSLVHEDEIDGHTLGRLLLPCSLRVLYIYGGSLVTLQPCFSRDMTRLTVLKMSPIDELESLQLYSCTALEKLSIRYCRSVDALEGFQSLRSLKYLKIRSCPGLPQCLENLSMQGYELCPRLERLRIDDPYFLTMPFCKHLTSLQCLLLDDKDEHEDEDEGIAGFAAAGLEAAFQLLTSLQQLRIQRYCTLSDLPVGLHKLPSLKRLEIFHCPSISRLPERGLPPSLEELNVLYCSDELTEQCKTLATSKIKVIIDEEYVN